MNSHLQSENGITYGWGDGVFICKRRSLCKTWHSEYYTRDLGCQRMVKVGQRYAAVVSFKSVLREGILSFWGLCWRNDCFPFECWKLRTKWNYLFLWSEVFWYAPITENWLIRYLGLVHIDREYFLCFNQSRHFMLCYLLWIQFASVNKNLPS